MHVASRPCPSITRLVSSGVGPIAIVGDGPLGDACRQICERRGLPYRVVSSLNITITRPGMVEAMLAEHAPWAVINTIDYPHVDEAEGDEVRCYDLNARGVAVLARACGQQGVRFVTFSSDLVFDGAGTARVKERDRVA